MHATLSLLWEPRDSFSIRLNFRIFNDTHTKTICHAPPHRLLRTCHPLLRTCRPPLLRTCTLRLTRNHLMHTWQPVCGSENYGNQGKSTNSFIQKCMCHCIYNGDNPLRLNSISRVDNFNSSINYLIREKQPISILRSPIEPPEGFNYISKRYTLMLFKGIRSADLCFGVNISKF